MLHHTYRESLSLLLPLPCCLAVSLLCCPGSSSSRPAVLIRQPLTRSESAYSLYVVLIRACHHLHAVVAVLGLLARHAALSLGPRWWTAPSRYILGSACSLLLLTCQLSDYCSLAEGGASYQTCLHSLCARWLSLLRHFTFHFRSVLALLLFLGGESAMNVPEAVYKLLSFSVLLRLV